MRRRALAAITAQSRWLSTKMSTARLHNWHVMHLAQSPTTRNAITYLKSPEQYKEDIHSLVFPSWSFKQLRRHWLCTQQTKILPTIEESDFAFSKHHQGFWFVRLRKHHEQTYATMDPSNLLNWRTLRKHAHGIAVFETHYIYPDGTTISPLHSRGLFAVLTQVGFDELMRQPSRVRYELMERKQPIADDFGTMAIDFRDD